MNELPPSRDFMNAATSERCETCGAPRGEGAVWIIAHPRWEHAACRDWSRHEFPYEWKLKYLRSLARAFKRSFSLTVRVGVFLKAARGRWPRAAQKDLEELKAHESELEASISDLRNRLDRR